MSEANPFIVLSYGAGNNAPNTVNLLTPVPLAGYPTVWTVQQGGGLSLLNNTTGFLNFIPNSNCTISMFPSLANTTLRLRDEFGTTLASSASTVTAIIFNLISGTRYNISLFNNTGLAIISGATIISNITMSATPQVSQFFTNGFQNLLTTGSGSNVSVASDPAGQPTYTFTNYPFVAGVPLVVNQALFAKTTASVSAIVSGGLTATIPSILNQVLSTNASFGGNFNPTVSGNFSGTIAFTILTVGIAAPQNFTFAGIANKS